MIAVIGATGNTGRAVAKELRALGENPVCVVRNPDKAREVLGADAKVAVAELTDRAALEKALQGVDRVFVVTGHNPQMVEQQGNVLEAALKAGVKYFVRVSGGRDVVGPDVPSVVGRGHHALEQQLAKSGIGWVNLRPSLFMQNTFGQAASIKADSKFAMPYPKDFPIAYIDVRDTGAVGARILRNPEPYLGQSLEFSGVRTNHEEFAKVFSDVLGRPITYVPITPEQLEAGMKSRNMPDWLVAHAGAIARGGLAGAFSRENTKLVHDLVGRPPITTKQFVTDFKGVFS
jgi:NAD(P)H dehydrogenase (quinone)